MLVGGGKERIADWWLPVSVEILLSFPLTMFKISSSSASSSTSGASVSTASIAAAVADVNCSEKDDGAVELINVVADLRTYGNNGFSLGCLTLGNGVGG